MRYAYAETTPVLNLSAPSQIRGGWPEVGTTAAESARLPHTHTVPIMKRLVVLVLMVCLIF